MFIIVPKNDLDWYSTQKILSQSFTEISRSANLRALRTAWKRESIEPDSVLITVVPRWTFLAISTGWASNLTATSLPKGALRWQHEGGKKKKKSQNLRHRHPPLQVEFRACLVGDLTSFNHLEKNERLRQWVSDDIPTSCRFDPKLWSIISPWASLFVYRVKEIHLFVLRTWKASQLL